MCSKVDGQVTRRAMLGSTAAAGLALPTMGMAMAQKDKVLPPSNINNPDQAIEELMKGNRRFIDGDMQDHDYLAAKRRGSSGQSPYAAFIRCADSRVAPEIVFDQTIGELFVCGVAGNIPTPELIASLEFSVGTLGSSLVVVMGHSNCGAVDTAIQFENNFNELPGELPNLMAHFLPAVIESRGAENRLEKAIELNARFGAERLTKESVVLADAVESGKCKIVSGVYDLDTGRFALMG
ncbi:MAG: carbonic anhydrase [Planctomycetota bacterium]|nr:carbonic anhydrase [Planctomycetota bacterium]